MTLLNLGSTISLKMSGDSCDFESNKIMSATSKQIKEFESGHKKIVSAVKGLSKKQLNFKIDPKEWSINQVIIHLADTESLYSQRMRKIIAEDNPTLVTVDQDVWANNLYYDKQDYKKALNLFIAQRKTTSDLLRFLPKSAWNSKGTQKEKVKTLYEVFISSSNHVGTHLDQIAKIKKDKYFPPR